MSKIFGDSWNLLLIFLAFKGLDGDLPWLRVSLCEDTEWTE